MRRDTLRCAGTPPAPTPGAYSEVQPRVRDDEQAVIDDALAELRQRRLARALSSCWSDR